MPAFSFTYKNPIVGSRARLGLLQTPHGIVETPAFIFCATKAAIKGMTTDQARDCDTQIILSNTYHLMLQPGAEIIAKMGGLHKFMGWNGPMLTDSGGFQIFSLGHGSVAAEIKGKRIGNRPKTLLTISEEGARFKSYLDGSTHLLTPEKSVMIQRLLGPDLVVVLDECTPYHVNKAYTRQSLELSHRWALRSLREFQKYDNGCQALYGIIQGGVYEDLRREGCDFVNSQPFFGHAIGGSLGADKEQMYGVVGMTARHLDPARPIHLLGIGGIRDIFEGVSQGIDTFDCVHPTRLARHGGALVRPPNVLREGGEHLNLRNSACREDQNPIEPDCPCSTCQTYSRAYLHHLMKAQELLGMTLITIHNVAFMNRLLKAVRSAIANGRLEEERKQWVSDQSNHWSSSGLAA